MKLEQCIVEIGKLKKRPYYAKKPPAPLSAAAIAKLRGPSGMPIPEELAQWLSFDSKWLPLFNKKKQLNFVPLVDLLQRFEQEMREDEDGQEELEELAEEVGPNDGDGLDVQKFWLELLPAPWLKTASVIELGTGEGSQEHFLTVDKDNKIRILGFHKRIEFWWKYESMAEWIGHWFGLIEKD